MDVGDDTARVARDTEVSRRGQGDEETPPAENSAPVDDQGVLEPGAMGPVPQPGPEPELPTPMPAPANEFPSTPEPANEFPSPSPAPSNEFPTPSPAPSNESPSTPEPANELPTPQPGSPICAPGFADCGIGCVDVTGDALNCGACGQVCESMQCSEGVCLTDGCGDGLLLDPELCDDGNTESGDGCDADCEVEPNWTCDQLDLGADGGAPRSVCRRDGA